MSECVHGFSLHHQGLILDHTLRLLVRENPANQASKINAMRTFSKPCKIPYMHLPWILGILEIQHYQDDPRTGKVKYGSWDKFINKLPYCAVTPGKVKSLIYGKLGVKSYDFTMGKDYRMPGHLRITFTKG